MRGLSRKDRKTVSNELPKTGFIPIPFADAPAQDQLCQSVRLKCIDLNASGIHPVSNAVACHQVR
jgi:hypothetical protein